MQRRLLVALLTFVAISVGFWFVAWNFAVPEYVAGSPVLKRDADGRYDIPRDTSMGRAWLPGLGGKTLDVNVSISGFEVGANSFFNRLGYRTDRLRLTTDGLYLSLNDIIVVCHSEDPFTRLMALELVKLMEEEGVGTSVKYYSQEASSDFQAEMPHGDLYIELFGADQFDSALADDLFEQVLVHLHTEPFPQPLSWNFRHPVNMRSINRYHLIETDLSKIKNYSKRAKLAIAVGEVIEEFRSSFQLLSYITSLTERIDSSRDVYFPEKGDVPQWQFLDAPQLREIYSSQGFLSPIETHWRLDLTAEEGDKFSERMQQELEAADWEVIDLPGGLLMAKGNDRFLFNEYQRVFSQKQFVIPYKYDEEGGKTDAYFELSRNRYPDNVEYHTEIELTAKKLYFSAVNARHHDGFKNFTFNARSVLSTCGLASSTDAKSNVLTTSAENTSTFWAGSGSGTIGGDEATERDEQRLIQMRDRLYSVFSHPSDGQKREYHLTYLDLADTTEVNRIVDQLLEVEAPLQEIFFLADHADAQRKLALIEHIEAKTNLTDEEKYWLAVAYSWEAVRDLEKAKQLAIEAWTGDLYLASLMNERFRVFEAARSLYSRISSQGRYQDMIHDAPTLERIVEKEWTLKDFPVTISSNVGERITIVFPATDSEGQSLAMESLEVGDIPERRAVLSAGRGGQTGTGAVNQRDLSRLDRTYAYFNWRHVDSDSDADYTWKISLRSAAEIEHIDLDNPDLKFYLIRSDVSADHADLAKQK